ncbi:glycoside hydrolase family 36 protein [Paenibacillus mendelii]|uniref:Glycoside hydrolase family 36 protein n=1 Tax=Paenibacillus mendelii TaxID=206163 RepID=A0ABV6J6K4_9BACL|nr:glycoside hydrolase family 36 protein [Paenibacillus mendelii]MCQ6561118.1 alpha-galactosidase [Paenibacillus mendelii]
MLFQAGSREFTVDGGDHFRVSLNLLDEADGIEYIRFVMDSDTPRIPEAIRLSWKHPAIDISGYWDPGANREKGLRIDFNAPFQSKATSLAPVCSLYNMAGQNRLTVAFSDAMRPLRMRAGIHEESAQFELWMELFTEACPPMTHYEAIIRIDTRDRYYADSLGDVGAWWASLPGYTPAQVPEAARLPMYSTWYSFHQQLDPKEIEKQCLLAKQLGCEAVIVDDGWQTANGERGYAYCGDWEASPDRIPDMRRFVDNVHEMGMKFILWYSVPFVGLHSKAWSRFEGKFMNMYGKDTAVFDPRFPEVRNYLIGLYERALRDWDIDGFKLDFVDSFNLSEDMRFSLGEGRDYDSVPEAVDRLLSDVMNRLKAIKPDVIIEFRQNYVGPLMRKYGNMFRVADCPNNFSQNRIGSIDIRLLSGNTAVHSDMMMWNWSDKAENVALQFIHSLFSVPQLSVLIDRIPEEHLRVVVFWLGFWRRHQALVLDGALRPESPDYMYPIVYAHNEREWLAAVYGEGIVRMESLAQECCMIINGTSRESIIVELLVPIEARMLVLNCAGEIITDQLVRLDKGIHKLALPPSGLIQLIRV